MFEKLLTVLLTIIFIGVIILAIVLGVTAGRFWVGALAFIGTILALSNIGAMGNSDDFKPGFFSIHILTVGAVAGAVWLSDLQPLWMVIVLMSFTAIPSVFVSDAAFNKSKGTGMLVVFINLLSTPLSIALPAVLLNLAGKQSLPPETWTWSLAVSAVAVLIVGLIQAADRNTGAYFTCVGLGLIPLVGAAAIVGFDVGWWWLLPWLASALLIGIGGGTLPKWFTKTGTIGIILAVLIGLVGVGLPLVNAGILPNPFQAGDGQPVAESIPAGTLSAVNIAATQLAAAEATATQAFLAEHEQALVVQTQTQQAIVLAEQQTQSAEAAFTATPTQLPEPTPTPTEQPETQAVPGGATAGPGFFRAIGTFSWQAIKSIWGILYLLIFIGLGQIWVKRWGGFTLFILLLLAVGVFGGRNGNLLALFVNLVTTGPANWWTHALFASVNWTGTMGWAILAISLIVTVLLIPALKIANQYGQQAIAAQKQGMVATQEFLSNEAVGCREYLATYIYLMGATAIPISLWTALHRLSTTTTSAFSFLFIPNLALPHWRPVWHYAYFVLGGMFLLTYALYMRMMRKNQADNPFSKLSSWGAIPVCVIMTLLVPSGIVLYIGGQYLLLSILVPILSPPPKQISYNAPRPAPISPTPKDNFEAYLDEIRGVAQEPPSDQSPRVGPIDASGPGSPSDHLTGTPVATLSAPLVGAYLHSGDQLSVLDDKGQLFTLVNGSRQNEENLNLDFPSDLLAANDSHLFAVGRHGQVISIITRQTYEISPTLNLGSAIRHATVNAYGTQLAYVSEEAPASVQELIIGVNRKHGLFDLGTESISCLTFSKNGHYLAAGTELGRLVVFDLITHQQVLNTADSHFGPMRMLATTEDDHWICIYRDGWLVGRDIQGHQQGPIELSNQATSLTIEPSLSRILIGDQAGYLWVYPQDLSQISLNKKVQDSEVTHIFAALDGNVITAGQGRVLRKVSI